VRILVLTKPVPDPAAGAERLGPDHRLDRAASPTVVNGNDEYALEAALQLVEAHGGEVAILAMAPANAVETMRKALAMGALRGILVTDPALAGADLPTTIRVLAAAIAAAPDPFDLILTGFDTSDGNGGAVAAGIAARLGLPLCSAAALIEPDPAAGSVRVRRLSAKGYDLVETSMPAVVSCTQALGTPRYPTLKGIMAARSREIAIRSLADLPDGLAPADGAWATRVASVARPPSRAAGRTISAPAADAAREVADFLADRRLI
jgi:electron transfer flavoprotein beta subunit